MDETKLTEEVICLKGEVCAIKESNINMKEDIVSLKSDVKKLEESNNTINIAIAKMDASIDNLGNRLTNSIENMTRENKSMIESVMQGIEADRKSSSEKIKFLLEKEKKRELEFEEDRKAVKDVKWNTIKVVLATLSTGLVTAFLVWLGLQ